MLELARSGTDVAGVVSFHGGLDAPDARGRGGGQGQGARAARRGGSVVPAAEVKGFEEEMRKAKVDWELVSYGGAVHSFTDPDANAVGQAHYDAKVAKRAFLAMNNFFAEAFAR